ncbi:MULTISPECIES: hypothetical protein [unclassified Carboxylicivirga]|uniref:hypothetical protein n=1 Tax=Carboxylicivirga TaxID=1628153 RepID=UPI003D326FE5
MKTDIKHKVKRLIQKVDQQDKGLSQHRRKVKWIAILGTLFTLYLLSFMKSHLRMAHQVMKITGKSIVSDSLEVDSTQLSNSPYSMPVDSFEQLLNQHIHENAD